MKTTPLTNKHIELGAKMAEFAGYNMPISYAGIKEEHMSIREGVGVFDVSHMGEFFIEGPGALDLLQQISSNDASKLQPGKAQYSCMPNNDGGIVDDLIIYRLPDEDSQSGGHAYMLVVNAANIEKDWNWIQQHEGFDVNMRNESDNIALLAVQGPKAEAAIQSLTSVNLADIKFYHFEIGQFAGIDDVIISATGYTGSGGFELYIPSSQADKVWDALFEVGKEYGIAPVGLGARDTLRLEMGYCLYGNDIDDTTSPLEAGLGWITKLKKGAFNSSDIFVKQKLEGISRKLIGFVVQERRVPRHGYEIYNEQEELIGRVTSGTSSPSKEQPIGLGYVQKEYSKEGTTLLISTGRKKIPAIVSKPPFIEKGN
ncbi:MAG: glycine cleavage system aminomethyltransferase GcvT [Bacteroidota bacterium]